MNDIEKYIFDSLASGKGVNLPGIGFLYVGRQAAELLPKGKVRPPQNKVFFSEGTNPSFGSAESIPGYAAWLAESIQVSSNILEITGVGVLRGRVFYPSVELHGVLNPEDNSPVKAGHKAGKWKKVFVGVLVVGTAALVMWLVVSIDFWTRKESDPAQETIAYEEQRDASARGESTIAPAVAAEAEEEINIDKEAKLQEKSTEDIIQKNLEGYASEEAAASSKTYFLVAGVFAEQANADKMISADPLKIGSGNYSKMPFGDKTLVSAYSSHDKASVEKRRRELSTLNEALWIYERTKKQF